MAKQLTDEELNLRRKLRRRLIGAAALTLAVVVILPMVLDREPKATGEDIELRIPAPDNVGEFVPGKATEELAEMPASVVAVAPSAISTVAETVSAVTPSLPISRAASPQSTAESPPVSPPAKAAEPVKSEPHLAKPEQASSPAAFVAQVGAYSNADTARQELAQLKKWGFKAYTEKAGDKIRVRVGPYAERDQADKARHLLEKHGLHPVVTSAK
jgi:DedD protein